MAMHVTRCPAGLVGRKQRRPDWVVGFAAVGQRKSGTYALLYGRQLLIWPYCRIQNKTRHVDRRRAVQWWLRSTH
eukprot:355193-Chlamydomonas_euryale.AAC.1